ncbi:unnamed protein product [Orchesella dallaii]|uniref:Uncharacterized protein n=1 Tax=Orchesella dallaii TaxID=48710 RepID=A0ABP1S7A7_9HEXA
MWILSTKQQIGSLLLLVIIIFLTAIISIILNSFPFISGDNSRKRMFWTSNRCCMVECESGDEENSQDLPRASSSFPGRNNSSEIRREEHIPAEMREANNSACAVFQMGNTSVVCDDKSSTPLSNNKSSSNSIAVGGRSEYGEIPCMPTV